MYVDLDYRQFDLGDGASIEIKPLNSDTYQKMLTFMTNSSISSDMDDEAIASATKYLTDPDFLIIVNEIIPEHCRNLSGITIKQDGAERAATINDLLKIGAFLTTRMNIAMKLFNISTLTEGEKSDVKK